MRWPIVVLVAAGLVLARCDDGEKTNEDVTPSVAVETGVTVIEQGTVANFGNVRCGVVSVDEGSAVLSLFPALPDGPPQRNVTMRKGQVELIEGGTLTLLEAVPSSGSTRGTVRLRFEPN